MGLDDFYNKNFNPFNLLKPKTTDAYAQQVPTLSGGQGDFLSNILNLSNDMLGEPYFSGDPTGYFKTDPTENTQQQQQLAQMLSGMFGGQMGQLGQPMTAQGLQEGSQPYLDSMMGQFQNQVVPQIANQFGALDSARSSGLGQAIGRQASALPGMAQQQFLGQRQNDISSAFKGLGFGNMVAGQSEQLDQMFNQNRLQNYGYQQQGSNPLLPLLAQLGMGTPAFSNMGMPGTQSASSLGGIGMGMAGIGAMGGTLGGAAGGVGSLLGGAAGGVGSLLGMLGGL